ncbi:MAG: sigma-70 family RNA polymerase sigma factor [Bacteroidia bacterium]|nr:sigma-70 family RNA polymerase sigma factor [Bacteroidia bacterium]
MTEPSSPDTTAAERALVARCIAGDEAAFSKLVATYQRLVGHIVFKLVKDEQAREELCQDIFVKVYRNLGTFRFESKLSTWIGRIAYHQSLNFLKRKKAPVVLYEDLGGGEGDDRRSGEETAAALASPLAAAVAQPDQELQRTQLAGLLQREIDHLPEVFRTILTLYHHQDLSYKEIGDILQLPEGTVKSYLFRARAKLRERLLKHHTQEEIYR